jgi:hypothetical protein
MTFRREWQYGKLVFVCLIQRFKVVRHLLSLRLATFATIMSTSKELVRWRRGRVIVGVASTKERRWLNYEDSGQSRRRSFRRVRVLLSTSNFPSVVKASHESSSKAIVTCIEMYSCWCWQGRSPVMPNRCLKTPTAEMLVYIRGFEDAIE